jgi:uncharacterized protein (DUF1697 family)
VTRWVGLLFSVILSAERRVTKADLLAVAALAGVADARTVLSTGNLIFDAHGSEAVLEAQLGAAIAEILGRAIPVFVRSADDLRAVLAANPFPVQTEADPAQVGIRILRRVPSPDVVARIAAKARPGEVLAAQGREFWVAGSGGLSDSALFRAAGAAWAGEGTFRSVSAVRKIIAVAQAD